MRVIPAFSALSNEFSQELSLDTASRGKRALIRLYLSSWDFDEEWYLDNNPDLKEALPSSTFTSGWDHFLNVGYFEGRYPSEIVVDNEWYMNQYEDVAAAILDGVFESSREHYFKLGRAEGRIPCDPMVDPAWYGKRYLEDGQVGHADARTCTDHFVRFGYLNGALPAPPL